jgi:hypothetical protein
VWIALIEQPKLALLSTPWAKAAINESFLLLTLRAADRRSQGFLFG